MLKRTQLYSQSQTTLYHFENEAVKVYKTILREERAEIFWDIQKFIFKLVNYFGFRGHGPLAPLWIRHCTVSHCEWSLYPLRAWRNFWMVPNEIIAICFLTYDTSLVEWLVRYQLVGESWAYLVGVSWVSIAYSVKAMEYCVSSWATLSPEQPTSWTWTNRSLQNTDPCTIAADGAHLSYTVQCTLSISDPTQLRWTWFLLYRIHYMAILWRHGWLPLLFLYRFTFTIYYSYNLHAAEQWMWINERWIMKMVQLIIVYIQSDP